MSTYTQAQEPITMVRGIADSLPLTWQAPDGTRIDVTGFIFAAALDTRDARFTLSTSVVNAAQGDWLVSWGAPAVAALPIGRVSRLILTITDPAAVPHVFDIPVNGVMGA